MRILVKRLMLGHDGAIVDYELNTPFAYFFGIVVEDLPVLFGSSGSEQDQLGPPRRTHTEPQFTSVEVFLAGLRFEHRDKLAELPLDLVGGDL